MRTLLNNLLIGLVHLYRWTVSPLKSVLFGPLGRCRFQPTCSVYALQALRAHGPFQGGWLAVKRVCRCHPWGGCGHDPVPPVERGRTSGNSQAPDSRRAPLLSGIAS